eukprot:TRINITY_DN7821_c0_g1_i2.p2 TRINITY_DN7821_c0_g1~~TRINITY_DN7821_c0_g1_i2.p2  ORF type:complete len:114 (-),score=17.41 TRINITY_DN7821_c0_g1_i2:1-342(-)
MVSRFHPHLQQHRGSAMPRLLTPAPGQQIPPTPAATQEVSNAVMAASQQLPFAYRSVTCTWSADSTHTCSNTGGQKCSDGSFPADPVCLQKCAVPTVVGARAYGGWGISVWMH